MAAEFTIDGTAYSTLGFDAEHDAVLDLALEDSTGLDAARVVFSVVFASDGAPALVFAPSTGIPATPTGTVTVTMPSTGAHSWRIQCQVNEGYDANGRWDATLTRERIISIRSEHIELRKLVPGETTQYDVAGWSVAQNEMVDAVDNAAGNQISYWEAHMFSQNLTSGAARYWMVSLDSVSSFLVRWRVARACTATLMTYTNQSAGSGTGTITIALCKVVADATVPTALAMSFLPTVRGASASGSVELAAGEDITILLTATGTISGNPQNNAFVVGFTAQGDI